MFNDNILDASMSDTATGHPEGKIFRYTEEGKLALIKNTRTKTTILFGVIIAGVIGEIAYMTWKDAGGWDMQKLMVVPFIVVISAFMYLFIYKGRVREQMNNTVDSYKLIVTPDGISREQKGLVPKTLNKSEITKITKNKKYYLVIAGSKTNVIGIPVGVNDPEVLEAMLSSLHPIESGKDITQRNTIISYLYIAIFLGGFATLRLTENKTIQISALGVLIAIQAITLVLLLKNKVIDKSGNQFRLSIFFYSFMLIGEIYSLFALLTQ